MKQACPSTEQVQNWWTQMQQKQATKIYPVRDGAYYRLRAFTDKRKKCGEISLGLRDKRSAQRIADSLVLDTATDDQSPAGTLNKYIDHLTKHANACKKGKYALTSLSDSTEHTICTIKSRLSKHFLGFCRKRRITDISEIFKREIINAYIDELYENVAIGDTSRSIMASTLTFLRWYDGKQENSLMNTKFYEAIKGWRSRFGFKRSRPKVFLRPDQIQAILRYEYPDERIKALFFFPLICGLRYNEFINLRWRDLDYGNNNLDVTIAKGGTCRKAQFPKVMQEFLRKVKFNRSTGNLPGDKLFKEYDRNRDLGIYKTLLKEMTGVEGKDTTSNCLRRSGCHLIEKFKHGLGDLQLGHSICSRVTHKSYTDCNDYEEVNAFWDELYRKSQQPAPITGIEPNRIVAEQANIISFQEIGSITG